MTKKVKFVIIIDKVQRILFLLPTLKYWTQSRWLSYAEEITDITSLASHIVPGSILHTQFSQFIFMTILKWPFLTQLTDKYIQRVWRTMDLCRMVVNTKKRFFTRSDPLKISRRTLPAFLQASIQAIPLVSTQNWDKEGDIEKVPLPSFHLINPLVCMLNNEPHLSRYFSRRVNISWISCEREKWVNWWRVAVL